MSDKDSLPPTRWPTRRRARWTGILVALIVAGWAAWYFGVEQPDDREAAALVNERAEKSFTIPGLNAGMVWLAPGTFRIGTPEQNVLVKLFYAVREKLNKQPNPAADHVSERPVTWVTLTQPFWLGRTTVTQGQYEQVMGTNPSLFTAVGRDAPVEQISWADAIAFCQKLTVRENADGRLPTGYAYTLPTEAQWEYACRAGTTGEYAGDLDTMAWYGDNSGGTTHPVGTKAPNAWGLYDMEGNVWEWCRDWYWRYPGGLVTNPRGASSNINPVFRGGASDSGAVDCRSAGRAEGGQGFRSSEVGFRLALVPATAQMHARDEFALYLYQVASGADPAALAVLGGQVLEHAATDAEMLNDFAWFILTGPMVGQRDLPLALRVAQTADAASHGTDVNIMDTYARALFMSGDTAQAIALQRKAVGMAPDAERKATFDATLKEYEAKTTANPSTK